MYKFSSHMLFQYLLQKTGMTLPKLMAEVDSYYRQPCWDLHLTEYNRVKSATLKPLHTKPRIHKLASKSPPRGGRVTHKPKVTIKRRRVFNRD